MIIDSKSDHLKILEVWRSELLAQLTRPEKSTSDLCELRQTLIQVESRILKLEQCLTPEQVA